MVWKREVIDEGFHSLAIVLFVVLAAVSFYIQSYLMLLFSIFCLTYFYIHQKYLQKIGNRLEFLNDVKRERLLIEEEGLLTLEFYNPGMSIWGGMIRILLTDTVIPVNSNILSNISEKIEIQAPFTLQKDKKGVIQVPVIGHRRGTCRISKVEIVIPHLFGSGKVIMEYEGHIKSKILVFPKPAAVANALEGQSKGGGDVSVMQSLFHDRFQPIGTRDYVAGDRFQDIHWKASARKQVMQTKIYAPSNQIEWMISLNLSDGFTITNKIEELIEYTTYLLYKAVEKNIHFGLVINVRSLGTTPFLFLPPGTGNQHLQHALELLSSLSRDEFTIPYDIVLQYLFLHRMIPSTFIHGGKVLEEDQIRLSQFKKQGIEVISLEVYEKQGVLLPWTTKIS